MTLSPRDAVIVDAVRTPIGRRKGSLAAIHGVELSAHVLRSLAERSQLDPALVDDVIWGCVQQVGQQSFNLGRNAVLTAAYAVTGRWHEQYDAVDHRQDALDFAAEIGVAGRVDDIDADALGLAGRGPVDRGRLGEDGDATFFFEIV